MISPDKAHRLDGEEWSTAERELLSAAMVGAPADFRVGDRELDDPAEGASWGTDRTLRAELLAGLLIGDLTPKQDRVRTVQVHGARITGPLSLQSATLVMPLVLFDCYIEETINLREATAPGVYLHGCHILSLEAVQLRTTGNVDLSGAFTARDKVILAGARIDGQLNLQGSSLTGKHGPALNGALLTVEQGLTCGDGFTAHGEIRLTGAHIRGDLDFRGARLINEGGYALMADRITVDADAMFVDRFTARGEVCLSAARIGGQLDFNEARLINEGGRALTADRLTVGQEMSCEDLAARGEVCLFGARIGGILNFIGAGLAGRARTRWS